MSIKDYLKNEVQKAEALREKMQRKAGKKPARNEARQKERQEIVKGFITRSFEAAIGRKNTEVQIARAIANDQRFKLILETGVPVNSLKDIFRNLALMLTVPEPVEVGVNDVAANEGYGKFKDWLSTQGFEVADLRIEIEHPVAQSIYPVASMEIKPKDPNPQI